MSRRPLILITAASLLLLALAGGSAQAHSVGNLGYVTGSGMNEDGVRNYDFDTQRVASDNVDWPVNLIFFDNASINTVKADLCTHGDLCTGGSTKNGRMDDEAPIASGSGCSNWCWDADSGSKTYVCGTVWGYDATDVHYRPYSPNPPDRMYNTYWGFYVFASSHWDKHDSSLCPGTSQYGWNEQAEKVIWQDWVDWRGTGAAWNNSPTDGNNYQPKHWAGDNYWDNSGEVTRLRVP